MSIFFYLSLSLYLSIFPRDHSVFYSETKSSVYAIRFVCVSALSRRPPPLSPVFLVASAWRKEPVPPKIARAKISQKKISFSLSLVFFFSQLQSSAIPFYVCAFFPGFPTIVRGCLHNCCTHFFSFSKHTLP